MENDTETGGEELSIDQAAAAYAKLSTPAVPTDQAKEDNSAQGDTETDDELQAADEDAGEEDDGETADADHAESEDDADDDPDSEGGRFVADNARVRITNPDGTTGFTTVAELKRGSLREADYTRKTQEVSAKHSEVERQSAAIEVSEKQLTEKLAYVESVIKSIVPAEPDPAMLQTDPVGYMQQKAHREQWMQHLSYLESEQQRAAQERQAKSGETEKETADREWNELLVKAPELKDPKRLDRFVSDMKEHASAYGIKPDELRAVALDHRQALVLRDAIAWRKLQASKPNVAKKVEGRPPVQKGGRRLSPGEHKARSTSDAINRLKQSGSEADAVAAYLASRKG